MMQLATYIKDLLYRYECVIIPGFGAFLTQHHSARIDLDTNTFHPPGKTLSFNRQLQTNDGLLANYVASAENCSYETALQQIRNFTGKLSLQLSEGETVSIQNIGEFMLNNERSVQFVPADRQNFNAASFGLSSFVSPAISRVVYKEETEKLESEVPLLFTPEKRMARPYLKYAAIGLIAIMATGFGGIKLYEGQVQKHNFVQKQQADSLVDKRIEEATFVISNPLPAMDITFEKETGRYHIVAGAFRIENNARKKVKQLLDKGYNARQIGKNKYGLHQVVYKSYDNRIEALRALRTLKNTENKDAWMLVRDLGK